jgi:hypothetical protein
VPRRRSPPPCTRDRGRRRHAPVQTLIFNVFCHDPIVRPGYWVQPFQDPWLVPDVRRVYWHTSHVWRVQYWLGRYVRNHEPIPEPTPFQKFQAAWASRALRSTVSTGCPQIFSVLCGLSGRHGILATRGLPIASLVEFTPAECGMFTPADGGMH